MPKPIKIFSSLSEANQALPINSPRKLLLNNQPFLIVRTQEGIIVTDNLCPHNKASLSDGRINDFNEIVCPLHEYRFDLHTGRESSQRCNDMQTFKILIDEGGVFLFI